ncbi:iron complex outermembrane recepter protein [Chitinophaga sp. CF118]|uniref:SusC/RagA family TonB-linked outer membrane protein n=1 Tax=Chitinophaga sp. CF118 TaxID=1884367 RepID=UPI0008F226CF|nr:SusC/RagA family TonB-linked outer membrane protein [Chitinophaga sp. CF118]SFD99449.1 iron complex outermembrane recepter protein [Chitinophaga sp. CF118]
MELLLHGKVPVKGRLLHANLMLIPILILTASLHVSAKSFSRIRLSSKNILPEKSKDASYLPHILTDIHGQVINKNGEPVAGVNVTIAGTSKGTVTDEKGNFQIQAGEGAVLVFSYVGYQTTKITLGASSTVSVTLLKSENAMNEVVVTALGIGRQKRALGYSQEQIKGVEIAQSNAPNVVNALSGKMAGVNITSPNGVDGGSTRIIIGGNNTITGDNQPLIIIDGMPMDNTIPAAAQDVTAPKDWGSAINLINPQDIEDMSVLKGPAAAALYGGRGANGVILITTKKGAQRKGLGVDYNFGYKVVQPYRYIKMQNEYGAGGMVSLDAPQYRKDASGNLLLTDGWEQSFVDQNTGSGPYGVALWNQVSWTGTGVSWGPKMDGTEITWWDGTKKADVPQPDNIKSYYRNGSQATHNIAISGGNDWGTLRASYTRADNMAIIPNSKYSQNSFNVGTAMKLSKRLNVQVNASYFTNVYLNAPALGNTEGTLQSNLIYAYSRNYRGFDDLGKYKLADGSRNSYSGFPWAGNGSAQYLYWNTYEKNETVTRRKLIGSAQMNYEATDFLNFLVRASVDANNNEDLTINSPTDATGTIGGTYGHGLVRDIANNYDWLATLHKDNIVKDFSAKLSVGGTFYKRSMYGISGTNSPSAYANPYLTYFANYAGSTQTSQIPSESWYDKKLNSVYSFLNLSYKNYLYLDITARNDWSSTLPKTQWSYFFPSFSASYIFSDAWHIDPSVLSFGKIRAAWAEGAVDVPPYIINTIYTSSSFAGQPTASLPSALPAINYKPQVNKTADFGVALGFLQNRINFDFRYYHGRATQQLLNSPLPISSGVSSIIVNTGVLENSGIEMILRARVVDQPHFKWDASLNMSNNRNRLLSLTEGATRVDMANIWGASGNYISAVVGHEFGTIMGYDYVYDSKTHKPLLQDEAMIMQNFGVDAATAAKMKGTMYQSTSTMVPIGNATPKFRGGITNTFSFGGGLSIGTLIDWKIGGQIWSGTYASTMQQGTAPQTLKERDGGGLAYTTPDGTSTKWGVVLPGVYSDGTVNTNVVHYYYKYMQYGVWSSGPNGSSWIHSTGVLKDTWYKLREVSINYSIPANIIKKTKAFQAASVSLVGRDLFYLYSSLPNHINPEGSNGAGNAQGIEFASLPGVRSVGVQLKVSF